MLQEQRQPEDQRWSTTPNTNDLLTPLLASEEDKIVLLVVISGPISQPPSNFARVLLASSSGISTLSTRERHIFPQSRHNPIFPALRTRAQSRWDPVNGGRRSCTWAPGVLRCRRNIVVGPPALEYRLQAWERSQSGGFKVSVTSPDFRRVGVSTFSHGYWYRPMFPTSEAITQAGFRRLLTFPVMHLLYFFPFGVLGPKVFSLAIPIPDPHFDTSR